MLRNKIREILVGQGRPWRKEGDKIEGALREVRTQEWEASGQVELEVVAEQIRSLNTNVRSLEKELQTQGGN